MKVTICGCSDDLVDIDGDIREEFNGDDVTLVFGDGTRLHVTYDKDGIWRIERTAVGTAAFRKTYVAVDADSPNYSDVVELEGDLVSVDKVRDREENIALLKGANWHHLSEENAAAIVAFVKGLKDCCAI